MANQRRVETTLPTTPASPAVRIVALTLFAAASLWINYEVKMNIQGRSSVRSVQEWGNVKVGLPAPDFSALDFSNRPVSLSGYRGQKVVLLDFWATWCGPCRAAMVGLETLREKYKDRGLEILSIDQGEDANTVARFIDRKHYGFHVLLDPNGAVSSIYGVQGIPSLALVDKQGVIQWLRVGYSAEETELDQTVERLLKP